MTDMPNRETLLRQARELEVASELHACMYPCRMTTHPDLDIAAYVRPASEISGDYYDFHTGEDGTLTIAIGDATGHGIPAGLVVTATKALFLALAEEPGLTGILDRVTHVLKQMRLCGHYMSLTLARYQEGTMRFAAAGMPFPLLFRAATRKVQRVELKGLPLGSHLEYPYNEVMLDLASGDTLLLMSDGVAELFNDAGEQFGYERVEALLAEVGHNAPDAIIDCFKQVIDTWACCDVPQDDVTMVVLKRRHV